MPKVANAALFSANLFYDRSTFSLTRTNTPKIYYGLQQKSPHYFILCCIYTREIRVNAKNILLKFKIFSQGLYILKILNDRSKIGFPQVLLLSTASAAGMNCHQFKVHSFQHTLWVSLCVFLCKETAVLRLMALAGLAFWYCSEFFELNFSRTSFLPTMKMA